ncbi:2693_t:CDS:2 [Dentiscutata heterogama]|uniref:2693_t:CDS:1 n=1 Tax=Dentiscutata heterogama TaxID=1316150 RepID=A0ACA9N248_9GLOM|nr:2693_t:CDS:2 [Dentiscutata heterogama]
MLRPLLIKIGECSTTLPESLPFKPQTEFVETVDKKDCKSQTITTKPVKKPGFSLIIEINTSVLNKNNFKTAFRDNNPFFASTTTNGSIDSKIVDQEINLKQHIFSTNPQFSRTEDRTILDYNNISLEFANNPAEFSNTDSQDEIPGTPSSTSSTGHRNNSIEHEKNNEDVTSRSNDENYPTSCAHNMQTTDITEDTHTTIDITKESSLRQQPIEITDGEETSISLTPTSVEDSSSSEQEQSFDEYLPSQPSHFKPSKKSTETSNSRPTNDPINYNHITIQEQTRWAFLFMLGELLC